MINVKLAVERTAFELLQRNPFYGNILMLLRRQIVSCPEEKCKKNWRVCNHLGVDTAAVVFQVPPILVINENFFLSLGKDKESSENLRLGVLEHEILHVVMKHDNIRFADENYKSDNKLLNIAMDLVINQLIQPNKLLPEYQTIEKYDFPKNKTTDWYFQELKKQKEKNLAEFEKKLKNGTLGGLLKGCCKQGEPQNGTSPTDWDIEKELALKSIIKSAYEAAQKSSKGIGNLPGNILEIINQILAPPKVPWNRELRNFPGSLGRAHLGSTIKRISKRFGTCPGNKIKGAAKILVAVDTSGSISSEDLSIFSNEIKHMHRNGAEVYVMSVDTKVHSVKPFNGKLPSVMGGGGTALTVIWDWIKETKFQLDALIILTDGYTSFDATIPLPLKTLWVIHKGSASPIVKQCQWADKPPSKIIII